MLVYALRRSLVAVPTLWAVVTLVFFAVRILPGDPALAALGNFASAEAIAAFREAMGLNRPLYTQYFGYLGDLLRGDLGSSLSSGADIAAMIADVLPYTVELTLSGVFIAVACGLPLGIMSALRQNTPFDFAGRIFSLVGLSIPAFLTGVLLILVFAIQLGWFPVLSAGADSLGEHLRQLALPAATIGLTMMAYVVRTSRAAQLNVLQQDYIRTARAKGLRPQRVYYGHALRNALIPVITIVGLYIGALIGNSVMTEIVFNRPGLGKLIVGAIQQRDYTVLQSLLLLYTSVVVIVNLLTDIAYGLIDPRIRYT